MKVFSPVLRRDKVGACWLGLAFLALVLLGFWTRLALALPDVQNRILYDAELYNRLALSLLDGQGLVIQEAGRLFYNLVPPLYPALLAVVYFFLPYQYTAGILINVLASLLIAWPLFVMGRRLGGLPAGVIAAFITLFYFEWLEASAVFLIAMSFACLMAWAAMELWRSTERLDRFGLLWAGALWALAGLDKSNGLTCAALLLLWLFFFWPRGEEGQKKRGGSARPAAIFFIGILLLAGPWAARNAYHTQSFTPLQSLGGVNLWMGNNPDAPDGKYTPRLTRLAYYRYPDLGERELSSALQKEALEFTRENPRDFVARTWNRLKISLGTRFWNPDRWIRRDTANGISPLPLVTFDALVIPAVLGFFILIRRREWRFLTMSGAIVLGGFAPVILMLGEYRFRIPFDWIAILLASVALGALFQRDGAVKREWPSPILIRRERKMIMVLGLFAAVILLLITLGIRPAVYEERMNQKPPPMPSMAAGPAELAELYAVMKEHQGLAPNWNKQPLFLDGRVYFINRPTASKEIARARFEDAEGRAAWLVFPLEKRRIFEEGGRVRLIAKPAGFLPQGIPVAAYRIDPERVREELKLISMEGEDNRE